MLLKSQQIFKSERHNVFTEEINKMALCSNGDKRIQPIDSIETHSHGISKDLIWKKEKSKRANIIRKYKYISL